MRWTRPVRKLRWYVQEYRWQGFGYFAVEMAFWRLRNLRHLYRVAMWKRMARRHPPDRLCFDVRGLQLYLNPQDAGLSAELAMERVHEPLLTAFLEDFLRPGMTVVDVGANLGYFTLIAARAVGPTGRVIALEPFPESYRLLQKNIKTNNQRNVFPLPLAAGAQPGTAKLYFYRQANWNGLFTHTGEPLGWVNVEVRPLDQILANEPRVDMIRMDVEGAELEVLEGGRKILDTFGPVIAMEVHPAFIGPVGCKQLSRLLSQFGYSVFYAWERWREEILWPRWVSRWYLPRSVSSSLDLDVVLSPEDWITKESGITIIVARSKDHTVNTAKFGNSSDLVRRTCCS